MTLPKMTALSIHAATNEWTLHVPSSLINKTGKKAMTIRIGSERVPKKVSLSSLPPSAASIHTKIKLTSNDGAIAAGPLLGIMTVRRGLGFKGNKKNFIDIMQTAKQLGALVYVFSVEDIHWENGTTVAYLYHENQKSWMRIADFPLPNVVYNRIPYREDEEKDYVQKAIRRLRAIPHLHLYNNHFFNKWDLYEYLNRNPKVANYIPETKKLQSYKEFSEMLNKHSLLYLKPISGKAGKGIMTVETVNGDYVLKVRNGNALIAKSFTTPAQLWSQIKQKANANYVVQQGIPLPTFEGRPFDIRVLVQKDDTGNWKLSGVGIRVAGKGGITTHVPRGGSIASPQEVLKGSMGESEYEKFMIRLNKSVLDLAASLEERFHSLGEASMDIGLSKDGKLWFFEANAKPMKFDEPHIRKTSLERIIQYSQYLSDFTSKGADKSASKTSNS